MDGSLRVGRIFRIPIEVHASWLFIFALIVWSLAADYFPMHHPGLGGATDLVAAVATALLFFASIVAHELAHSLVARAGGIPVERITLFALGGVSALEREAGRPRAELVVALIGPLASLLIGAALWWVSAPLTEASMTAGAVALYLAYGNVALGVFNLVPAFPLDGGRALRAVLWALGPSFERATLRATNVSHVAAVVLVLFGTWQAMGGAGAGGLWLVLVGWSIWTAADQEGHRAELELALRHRSIAPLVRFEFIALDAEQTLAEAAERIMAGPAQAVYPVLAEGRLLGLVTPAMFRAMPQTVWRTTRMHWLARRAPSVPSVSLDADALRALSTLDALHVDALPVEDESAGLIGLLERGAIARWVDFASGRARRPLAS